MTEMDVTLMESIENPLTIAQSMEGVRSSGSRYLFRGAARSFGVELEDQEDEDWRAMLGGAYLVDHLLDIDKTDIMPGVAAIVSGELIEGLHERTQVRFREYMLRQEESRYDDIIRRLEQVSSLSHRQALAESAQEVIDIRREEADLLAYLLGLPTHNRRDSVARERFNDWLVGWSRCGYLLDTLIDMKLDYDNGDSGVRPTTRAKAVIAGVAVKESLIATRKTPLRLLGKCALVGARYLLLNKKPDLTDLQRR